MCAGQTEQKLQCYACGMPKVNPEFDLPGSYGLESGKKTYNHSCDDMYDSVVDGKVGVGTDCMHPVAVYQKWHLFPNGR